MIDGSTGAVEWKSISLGDYWSEISRIGVADVDGDAVLEIVAINDSVFVVDGISHIQWQSMERGYEGLDLFPVAGDARPDIVTGTTDGRVLALDGSTHAALLDLTVSSESLVGLVVSNLDSGSEREIVFASGGKLAVRRAATPSLLWESEVLGQTLGRRNGLAAAEIYLDSRVEVLVGTELGVVQFQGPDTTACGWVAVTGRPRGVVGPALGWTLASWVALIYRVRRRKPGVAHRPP